MKRQDVFDEEINIGENWEFEDFKDNFSLGDDYVKSSVVKELIDDLEKRNNKMIDLIEKDHDLKEVLLELESLKEDLY